MQDVAINYFKIICVEGGSGIKNDDSGGMMRVVNKFGAYLFLYCLYFRLTI